MTRKLIYTVLALIGLGFIVRTLCLYGKQALEQLDRASVMASAFPEDPRYRGFNFDYHPNNGHVESVNRQPIGFQYWGKR